MHLKSLKNNILIYLLVFTIIPLFLGSSIILYNGYNSEKKNILYNHSQYLKQAKAQITSLLEDIEDKGEYVKKNYSRKKHNLVTGLLHVSKSINTIMILNNDGILTDFSSSTNDRIFIGYDYSNTHFFKALQKGKKSHWTDVYLSWDNYTPSISYSFRIDPNTLAVFIINLRALDDFSDKFKSGDGSSMIRIVDKEGIYISYLEYPEAVYQRKTILNTEVYKKYIKNNKIDEQIIFFDSKKEKNIGVYGLSEKLHWTIIIKEKYDYVFKTYYANLWFIILFTLLLFSISIYFSFRLSKSILRPLDLLSDKMDDIAKGKTIEKIEENHYSELEKLSQNFLLMQKKIALRENENRQKDKQIYDSIKMAQMGEMIGNIAHQWRQPLNALSLVLQNIHFSYKMDELNDEFMDKSIKKANLLTNTMSKTIDDFRNFFKPNKEKKEFLLDEVVSKSITLIESTFKHSNIELEYSYEKLINIFGFPNEFSQVVLNILNNARDALLENKIENARVIVNTKMDKNFGYVIIRDNAGGIPNSIINKIFNPYFTTKEEGKGTGIGLYMSKTIIETNMDGKLIVENVDDGAEFIIRVPLVKVENEK